MVFFRDNKLEKITCYIFITYFLILPTSIKIFEHRNWFLVISGSLRSTRRVSDCFA